MKYFLHIGYDGTNYHGWQRQPDVISVQQVIEETLQNIFKTKVTAYGCGRTDAGVHASQYILHINLDAPFDFDLKFILNKNLPADIAVYDLIEGKGEQHARFDATWRTYDYFIHLQKDPALSNYSSLYEIENLDFDVMHKAVSLIAKQTDFKELCRRPDIYKHTRCIISNAKLYVAIDQQRLRFTITGNRFLHGMIRICVRFLLEIGRGKMSLADFQQMLKGELDIPVKRLALPNGLYLSQIEYPYLNVAPRTNMCSLLKAGLEE